MGCHIYMLQNGLLILGENESNHVSVKQNCRIVNIWLVYVFYRSLPCPVVDNHDGTYGVKYTAQQSGMHSLSICIHGTHIKVRSLYLICSCFQPSLLVTPNKQLPIVQHIRWNPGWPGPVAPPLFRVEEPGPSTFWPFWSKVKHPSQHTVKCYPWWKRVHQIASFKMTLSKKLPTFEGDTSSLRHTLHYSSRFWSALMYHVLLWKFAPSPPGFDLR